MREPIYPKEFFKENKEQLDNGFCFAIMPFSAESNLIFNTVSNSLSEVGMRTIRADKIYSTQPIMVSIMQSINRAEVVIADLTGKNPNVLYELGMAHVLKDNVILLAQDIRDVPFDLTHLRVILYERGKEGALKLRSDLIETLRAIGVGKLPKRVVALPGSREQCMIDQLALQTAILAYYYHKGNWPTRTGSIPEKVEWFAGSFVPSYILNVPDSERICSWAINAKGMVCATNSDCPCYSELPHLTD